MVIARKGMCELKEQVKNFFQGHQEGTKDGKSKQKVNKCDGYILFTKYIIITKQRGRILSRNKKLNFTKLKKKKMKVFKLTCLIKKDR